MTAREKPAAGAAENDVARAMLVIRMREGTTYGTNAIRVSYLLGVPYLVFVWPTAKIDGEIKVPLRDVAGVYCAWAGTEDQKWRAVSQAFGDGILPMTGAAGEPAA